MSKHFKTSLFPFAAFAFVVLGGCSGGTNTSTLPPSPGTNVPQSAGQNPSGILGTQSLSGPFTGPTPKPSPTPVPTPVAYVPGYYSQTSGSVTKYTTVLYSLNTNTYALTGPLATVAGFPGSSALSNDGARLYVTLPFVQAFSNSSPSALTEFTVSPTSAQNIVSSIVPSGDTAFASVNTTGASNVADVSVDTPSSGRFSIDYAVSLKPYPTQPPALSGRIEYAEIAPAGTPNSYLVDTSGNFRTYYPATNKYSNPISGLTPFLATLGIPVLAVLPNGSAVYGLAVDTNTYTTALDVINPTSQTITKKVAIAGAAYQVLSDRAGANVYVLSEAFVGSTIDYYVSVVATNTNTVTKAYTLANTSTSLQPFIAVSPDGLHLFVSINTGNASSAGGINVITAATGAAVKTITLPIVNSQHVQVQQVVTQL